MGDFQHFHFVCHYVRYISVLILTNNEYFMNVQIMQFKTTLHLVCEGEWKRKKSFDILAKIFFEKYSMFSDLHAYSFSPKTFKANKMSMVFLLGL